MKVLHHFIISRLAVYISRNDICLIISMIEQNNVKYEYIENLGIFNVK